MWVIKADRALRHAAYRCNKFVIIWRQVKFILSCYINASDPIIMTFIFVSLSSPQAELKYYVINMYTIHAFIEGACRMHYLCTNEMRWPMRQLCSRKLTWGGHYPHTFSRTLYRSPMWLLAFTGYISSNVLFLFFVQMSAYTVCIELDLPNRTDKSTNGL